MVILVLLFIALMLLVFVGVAVWQASCWGMRKVLDIPKYPPYQEPEPLDLPWYLDDRKRRPDGEV